MTHSTLQPSPAALVENGRKLDDGVSMARQGCWKKVEIHSPRPEQQAAIDEWNKTQSGVVVMPTETGKTEVALHLMANHPCSTLVVAPVRDLMYQWHRRILNAFDCDAGIIGDNTFNVRPISVKA